MHTDRTPVTLRREITPGDVERMMDWMGNPNVTRYLNEDKHVTGQLSRLLSTVPGPMLTYHFNRDCRFFLICIYNKFYVTGIIFPHGIDVLQISVVN